MCFQHCGKLPVNDTRKKLRHILNQNGFNTPEVSQGLCHFNPYGSAPNNNCLPYFSLGNTLFYLNSLVQVGNGKDTVKSCPGKGKINRLSTGSQHKFIVRQALLFT